MALLTSPRQLIELALSPRQLGGLSIAQKARLVAQGHQQNALGECSASIVVLVTMYAPDGTPLTGPGFQARQETLLADNQTLVDAKTGEILAICAGGNTADWQAKINELGTSRDVLLQGDFFEQLRGLPVVMGDMIRQYIQQADAAGKFA